MMIKKWVGFLGKKNTETKQAYHELMAAYEEKCKENHQLVIEKKQLEENYHTLNHCSFSIDFFDSWETLLSKVREKWLMLWIEQLSDDHSVCWNFFEDCRYAATFCFLQDNEEVLTQEEKTLVIEKTGYAKEKISRYARMYQRYKSWDEVDNDD